MSFHSKFVVCLILLFLSGSATASKRPDLYKLGKDAYDQGKYVTALKNLYAFYVLNEDELAGHPDVKKSLTAAIDKCETTLGVLFKTNANVAEGEVYILNKRGIKGKAMEIGDLVEAPSGRPPPRSKLIEDKIRLPAPARTLSQK